MTGRKFGEVGEFLQAAFGSGYTRPWMYEALGLALEANKAPAEEVERAILSATDLRETPTRSCWPPCTSHGWGTRRGFEAAAGSGSGLSLRPDPTSRDLELADD